MSYGKREWYKLFCSLPDDHNINSEPSRYYSIESLPNLLNESSGKFILLLCIRESCKLAFVHEDSHLYRKRPQRGT